MTPTTRDYSNGEGYVFLTPTAEGLVVGAMDDVGAYGTADVTVPWDDVRAMMAEADEQGT